MHTTKVKTIWRGTKVAVNEYEIAKGIKAGGLRIVYEDQFMDIKWQDLATIDIEGVGRAMPDKFGRAKTYRLVDFEWKPKGIDKQEQLL